MFHGNFMERSDGEILGSDLPPWDYLDDIGRPCWRLDTIRENWEAFKLGGVRHGMDTRGKSGVSEAVPAATP